MITPIAPAVTAFCNFRTNEHVPRWISATAPATSDGKSDISQPLVLPPTTGGMTMSLVGTTRAFETDFVGECSNAMKSTPGESSSAALPGM